MYLGTLNWRKGCWGPRRGSFYFGCGGRGPRRAPTAEGPRDARADLLPRYCLHCDFGSAVRPLITPYPRCGTYSLPPVRTPHLRSGTYALPPARSVHALPPVRHVRPTSGTARTPYRQCGTHALPPVRYVLGGGAWLLTVQGTAEAIPRPAVFAVREFTIHSGERQVTSAQLGAMGSFSSIEQTNQSDSKFIAKKCLAQC